MDQETIQKIAAEIASHVPYPWALLAVQTVLMVAAGALVAYFGEYFKTRGKHLATKADFNEVLSQVRANTELVETVRAEVSQKDWAKREWTNLRRIKLEELLNQMHECEAYLDRHRNNANEGKVLGDPDPRDKLGSLGTLYFPELESQIYGFSRAYSELLLAAGKMRGAMLDAQNDLAARKAAHDKYSADQSTMYPKLLNARTELKNEARRLLVKIVGVED